MNSTDFAIIGIVVLILAIAIAYIIKSKKNGVKCIGCPYSKSCSSKQSCNHNNKKEI